MEHRRQIEAMELQRKQQQGLGKPIISTEFSGQRVVAVGNTVYFNQAWKTFPDFLLYYLAKTLGHDWGNAELQKPEGQMHPVALWYRKVCGVQAAHAGKRGEVFGAPETGASHAYLELAYDLYLLEHNAELRDVLIGRLKNADQFVGALSEIRVAGMLVRAGFSIQFQNEGDSTKTHCEYDAKRLRSAKSLSVEVKTRNWETWPTNDEEGQRQIRICVGRLLRDALDKQVTHDRVVFIELAMPDESASVVEKNGPWWMQAAMDGVRETEARLTKLGKEVPPTRVIVCNHPHRFHLDSTCSVVGYALDGIGPTDFRTGKTATIREALRFREKHADMFALWKSIEEHRKIPQTFDGRSHYLAFGDHPPRLIVGQKYSVPNESGGLVSATLEDAVAIPSERVIHGIYHTETGQRIICTNPLTEAEAKAYAEQPDTFFGVVKKQGSLTGPMEMFDFLFETYGTSSKESLLKLMSNWPNVEALRSLPQRDLAEIYCECLTGEFMRRTGKGGAAK